jgi:hypothetical protein
MSISEVYKKIHPQYNDNKSDFEKKNLIRGALSVLCPDIIGLWQDIRVAECFKIFSLPSFGMYIIEANHSHFFLLSLVLEMKYSGYFFASLNLLNRWKNRYITTYGNVFMDPKHFSIVSRIFSEIFHTYPSKSVISDILMHPFVDKIVLERYMEIAFSAAFCAANFWFSSQSSDIISVFIGYFCDFLSSYGGKSSDLYNQIIEVEKIKEVNKKTIEEEKLCHYISKLLS